MVNPRSYVNEIVYNNAMSKPILKKRFLALFYDYLVILGWMAFLAGVSLALYLSLGSIPDYFGTLGPVGAQLLFFSVLTLPVGLYLFVTEAGKRHATFGKRRTGLTVVGTNGRAPTKVRILVRTIIKLLPWEIAHTFMWQMQFVFYKHGYDAMPDAWIFVGLNVATVLAVMYVAMVVFRRDGRGPHDLIAGTQVVANK